MVSICTALVNTGGSSTSSPRSPCTTDGCGSGCTGPTGDVDSSLAGAPPCADDTDSGEKTRDGSLLVEGKGVGQMGDVASSTGISSSSCAPHVSPVSAPPRATSSRSRRPTVRPRKTTQTRAADPATHLFVQNEKRFSGLPQLHVAVQRLAVHGDVHNFFGRPQHLQFAEAHVERRAHVRAIVAAHHHNVDGARQRRTAGVHQAGHRAHDFAHHVHGHAGKRDRTMLGRYDDTLSSPGASGFFAALVRGLQTLTLTLTHKQTPNHTHRAKSLTNHAHKRNRSRKRFVVSFRSRRTPVRHRTSGVWGEVIACHMHSNLCIHGEPLGASSVRSAGEPRRRFLSYIEVGPRLCVRVCA